MKSYPLTDATVSGADHHVSLADGTKLSIVQGDPERIAAALASDRIGKIR